MRRAHQWTWTMSCSSRREASNSMGSPSYSGHRSLVTPRMEISVHVYNYASEFTTVTSMHTHSSVSCFTLLPLYPFCLVLQRCAFLYHSFSTGLHTPQMQPLEVTLTLKWKHQQPSYVGLIQTCKAQTMYPKVSQKHAVYGHT